MGIDRVTEREPKHLYFCHLAQHTASKYATMDYVASFFGFGGEPTIAAPAAAARTSQDGMKQPRRNSMNKTGWEGTFNPGRNNETKKLGSSKFDSGNASVWQVIDSANPSPIIDATDKVPERVLPSAEGLVSSGGARKSV